MQTHKMNREQVVEAWLRDRRRLWRVLGMAKGLRDWVKANWYSGEWHRALENARRCSAAWKAAAKDKRVLLALYWPIVEAAVFHVRHRHQDSFDALKSANDESALWTRLPDDEAEWDEATSPAATKVRLDKRLSKLRAERDELRREMASLLEMNRSNWGRANEAERERDELRLRLEEAQPMIVDAKRIVQSCRGYYHDNALELLASALAALRGGEEK